ncbi:ubiquinone biosynthesis hydrox [Artomyces pyxidatus]|uniref:Ubiquinone biosynthesis hydrox n=1 Tax=Artomyces pyxidatus TaxID=48021 RepID=A0ACB8SY00_9AGAM|nr:ubiquinone biosynthesis hydrox [Artomyces pyxidatus]
MSRRRSRGVVGRAYSVDTREECDVVIVGGGPAGLALASALGASNAIRETLTVTLVEAGDLAPVRDWNMPPDAFANRVSSLTNASQRFLEAIGSWKYVDEPRTCPIEHMQVWDGISDARIDFNAMEMGSQSAAGSSQMARLTENSNLQRGLLRHLDSRPSISLFDRTKVESIKNDRGGPDGWPTLYLSNGRVLRARLLVGADGFSSPVRSYAGIQSFGWNYPTQAIVATLHHSPRTFTRNTTAYQRFLPTGPIAFLPLSPTVSSLVWSTRPPLAAALTKADPHILACMINAAFRLPEVSVRYLHERILEASNSGKALTLQEIKGEITWRENSHNITAHSAYASGSVDPASVNIGIPPDGAELLPPLVENIQPGTAASFPLRFNHAEAYIGEGSGARTVLVGDAAHTIHPLAGQGLNLGLADVECLARCIENAVQHGGDIGSHTALAPYARERYFENHKMMSAVDKLHKLYAATAPPVVWARSVGVEVLNELDALKAGIVMSAGASGSANRGTGWDLAARGAEALMGSAKLASAVRSGLRATAAGALQQLARAMANQDR